MAELEVWDTLERETLKELIVFSKSSLICWLRELTSERMEERMEARFTGVRISLRSMIRVICWTLSVLLLPELVEGIPLVRVGCPSTGSGIKLLFVVWVLGIGDWEFVWTLVSCVPVSCVLVITFMVFSAISSVVFTTMEIVEES